MFPVISILYFKNRSFPFLAAWIALYLGLHAQQTRYPYQIAKAIGSSYDSVILSSEVRNPLPMILGVPSQTWDALDRLSMTKLLEAHAMILAPSQIAPNEINAKVERQLQAWHQAGMNKEAVKAHLEVSTFKEVIKKLRKKIHLELAIEHFVDQILPDLSPTPSEVKNFYNRHLASRGLVVPPRVLLLELVCYPTQRHPDKDLPMDYLSRIYRELLEIKVPEERKRAFVKVIHKTLKEAPSPMRYGYLSGQNPVSELLLEEIPKSVKEAFLSTGAQKMFPGLLTPPHTFTDDYGNEGVRIILVEKYQPSHTLNLEEDYGYVAMIWRQWERTSALKRWWELHQKETERYG